MIFHMGSHKEFAEWLDEKITRLGISQTQLAKASGLSVSQISRIIRMESTPGAEALDSIARALFLPTKTVFIMFGLLDAEPEDDEWVDEVVYKMSKMDHKRRKTALNLLNALLDEQENE